MKKCINSYTKVYSEGGPAVKCAIKNNIKAFILMKEKYEYIHRGFIMTCSDECEFARHSNGQIDCPCYEPQ